LPDAGIQPKGALELTWTNKRLRLIESTGGAYDYAWVEPSDYRVAEVRLLHEAATVGEPSERHSVRDNLLVRGDALHALRSLTALPGYAAEYAGKVKLAYLDPPFNTGKAFEHYQDALEHSIWLTMMRDRLRQIDQLLAPGGSIWVHCDDSEQAYLKVLMDEIFTRDNFVAVVVWEKADSPRMDAKRFSSSHDYIIVYAKSDAWVPNRLATATDDAAFPYVAAAGRRYSSAPLRKWGKNSKRQDRPNLWYPLTAPTDIDHPNAGKEIWPVKPNGDEGNWRWKRDTYEANREQIEWRDKGSGLQPYVITYAGNPKPRPPVTFWPNTEVGHNREAKAHLKQMFGPNTFETPKPERLMARILEVATKPGDLVLDCFLGSGTTAAVAHKMGRRWIGIELSHENLERFALPRLTRVADGAEPGGVTKAVDWKGGGGFSVLDVAPSMFDVEDGVVVLAGWATGGALAEATAAQLGFVRETSGPFCGRKGRTRLAVVDGLVNQDVLDILLGNLADGENLLVCGTGIDDEARDHLATVRPGSGVQPIPQAILASYGRPRRWRPSVPSTPDTAAQAAPESANEVAS
jgi:adenine-specific DNA-methyltransferase